MYRFSEVGCSLNFPINFRNSCHEGLPKLANFSYFQMFKLCQFTVPAEYADKFADYYKDTIIVYISDDFDPGEIAIPLG